MSAAAAAPVEARIDSIAEGLHAKVVAWRRDIHANPELGNREFRTAKLVADHLRALGLEVRERIAHTGVVGVLEGEARGPTVALRADMDALPVEEEVDVPFRSRVKAEWSGMQCGVMHACGHDAHTAILMGVAETLAGLRSHLRGSVKFLFQPAEEGPPEGEAGGARLMIEERCLEDPRVGAVFGLHTTPGLPTGRIGYRSGPLMASSDDFRIFVRGSQTHAAMPWRGADPIVAGAQIVEALQTVVSRRLDITHEPSVVSVGVFRGGVRKNIIPDSVELAGTIRTFDEAQRGEIHDHVTRIAEMIAAAGGASAQVRIRRGYDVVVNDAALTQWAVPVLQQVAGRENVGVVDKLCAAEDFSFYQKAVPGLFLRLGSTPPDRDLNSAAPNHSPRMFLDEDCMKLGVKALAALALRWLERPHA
jgi:amidohydrolase